MRRAMPPPLLLLLLKRGCRRGAPRIVVLEMAIGVVLVVPLLLDEPSLAKSEEQDEVLRLPPLIVVIGEQRQLETIRVTMVLGSIKKKKKKKKNL